MGTMFNNLTRNLDELPLFGRFVDTKGRRIWNPNDAMRTVHTRMIALIGASERPWWMPKTPTVHEHVTTFLPENCWNKCTKFYVTDLKNAYGSVSIERLVTALCWMRMDWRPHQKELAETLSQYFLTEDGGLIVGGPASPLLFHLYALHHLDRWLKSYCRREYITYSRYVDDLTFGSVRTRIGHKRRREIRTIIEKAGFRINHRKSRVLDTSRGAVTLTGITACDNRLRIPSKRLRAMRSILRSTLQGKQSVDESGIPYAPDRIHGLIGYLWVPHGGALPQQQWSALTRQEQKVLALYTEWKHSL